MRHAFRLLVALTIALFIALPTMAADRAIIILDASGSMWAQIEGKARIEIARDTLTQVLSGIPSDLELGFMAYGHRSKGDCKDIELMVPPATGTAEAIAAAAKTLSPKGKTPLSAAVRMAAEELKYTEDKATVVLITDGIETCNADPCALATELEKAGVDFTVNVVGFGLSKADGAAVKCLADNTHGIYISADDEDGLKNAIEVAVNETPAPAPEPTPVPEPEPATDITFAPTAVLVEGGDPLLENQGNAAWEFYKINADGSEGEWVRTEYGNAYKGAIEPGTYLVTAKLDYAHVQQKVTIEAGKTAKPVFDLEAGYLNIRPLDAEGGEVNSDAAVYTEFPDTTSTTSYGEVKTYVPAGTTKIEVKIGTATASAEAAVAAGDAVIKDIVVAFGHASITGSYAPGVSVTDSGFFVEILDPKKDIQGNRVSITNGYGPTVELDLSPGDYIAVGSYGAARVEQPFSIKARETTSLDVNLNAGVLVVTTENGSYTEILSAKKDIQGNRESLSGNYDQPSSHTLPAGDYHVLVSLKDGSASKEADVKVVAGERNEVTVQ